MKNNEITIVTAFFPINRDNWKDFSRSTKKYLDFFEFWARIQNDMIIYTTKELVDEIENIRIKKLNRKNTKVVVIDDYKQIDNELYLKICDTVKTDIQKQYKICYKNPESRDADYNYMTNLKTWFVKDAVEKEYAKGMIAWVDFGFNHNGEVYPDSDDFNFLWDYKYEEKINIFHLYDLDNLPIFEVIRCMHSYIQGSVMIAPDYLWGKFYGLVKESLYELADIGLSDDDQTITLMAYRKNPELFNMIKLDRWHVMFKYFSNGDFKINPLVKHSFLKKLKNNLNYRKNILRYSLFWYKELINDKTKE